MKYTVDRIEDDYIILEIEPGKTINVPISLMPEAKENDIIEIKINKEETNEQEEKIKALMDEAFED